MDDEPFFLGRVWYDEFFDYASPSVDYQWPYGRHALRPASECLPVYDAVRSDLDHP